MSLDIGRFWSWNSTNKTILTKIGFTDRPILFLTTVLHTQAAIESHYVYLDYFGNGHVGLYIDYLSFCWKSMPLNAMFFFAFYEVYVGATMCPSTVLAFLENLVHFRFSC